MKKQEEIHITVKEFTEMGDLVANVTQLLEAITKTIGAVPNTHDVSKLAQGEHNRALLYYNRLYNVLDSHFYTLQTASKQLDDVAFKLLNVDDKEEIRGY